jgi:hypothetical protein
VDYEVVGIHPWLKFRWGLEFHTLAFGQPLVWMAWLAIYQQTTGINEDLPLCLGTIGESPAEIIQQAGSIPFGANQGFDYAFCHRSMIDFGALGV